MAGEQHVTSILDQVELQGFGQRVSSMMVLTEMGALGLYAISMIVLVEMEATAGVGYAVGLGHDIQEGFLTRLSPQPHTEGIKITRRDYSGGDTPAITDNKPYIDFVYSGLGSAAQYRDVLDQWGLLTQRTQKVTVWAKGSDLDWVRRNGLAIRPLLNRDARWTNFFPRDIVIRVINIEVPTV